MNNQQLAMIANQIVYRLRDNYECEVSEMVLTEMIRTAVDILGIDNLAEMTIENKSL